MSLSRIWKKKWINIGPVNLHPDLSGRPDISFRVWNFEKYKVASIFFSFFKVWTMFFLLTVWNLKEKRPGCLFSLWITTIKGEPFENKKDKNSVMKSHINYLDDFESLPSVTSKTTSVFDKISEGILKGWPAESW